FGIGSDFGRFGIRILLPRVTPMTSTVSHCLSKHWSPFEVSFKASRYLTDRRISPTFIATHENPRTFRGHRPLCRRDFPARLIPAICRAKLHPLRRQGRAREGKAHRPRLRR